MCPQFESGRSHQIYKTRVGPSFLFFMNETLPRIHGTEIEYGFLKAPGNSTESPLSKLHDHLPSYVENHEQYLTNGARIYIDIGDHPEYATPESRSFRQTVAAEIAGEIIMRDVMDSMVEHKLLNPGYRLHKRVVDSRGVPSGAHESYSTDRYVDPSNFRTERVLATHNITRSILFGAGAYDGFDWKTTQKLTHLDELSYPFSHTRDHRPVVDLRDEPLADETIWRRIHTTCGDANISPWAIGMKLATTSLVLRLVEHNVDLSDLYLNDVFDAADTVTNDMSLSFPVQTMTGDWMTAAGIQLELALRAEKLSKSIELPSEELWAIAEWKEALHDAATNIELLADRVDWVAKRAISTELAGKKSIDRHSQNLKACDQLYDLIDEKRGLGLWLRQNGSFRNMPSANEIDTACMLPPDDTRAKLRGRIILAASTAHGRKMIGSIDKVFWDKLRMKSGKIFDFGNPYVCSSGSPELELCLEHLGV